MISSNTVAAASIRLTCSDGSSVAVAVVLAKKVAASTVNIPNLNLIEEHLSFARIRAILKSPITHARSLVLIGEMRIANRRQCRFLPEVVRNEKEAWVDDIETSGLVLSPSRCTNSDDAL
jgi:hypothetical protein